MNSEKPLTYLLGQTFTLMRMKLKESFKENYMDFSMEQYIMLNLINHKNDLTQQDLANHFQKDKSLILRQVNVMIKESYVERETGKDDKRKKILILTPRGREVLERLKAIAKKVSEELLEGVTDNEKNVFQAVIQKIQNNTGQIDLLSKIEGYKK